MTGSLFHKPNLTDINYITLFNSLLLKSFNQPFHYFARDKHQVDRAIITGFVLFSLFMHWHNIRFLPGFWNFTTDPGTNISVTERQTCHHFKNCLWLHRVNWLLHLHNCHRMCIMDLTEAQLSQEQTPRKDKLKC